MDGATARKIWADGCGVSMMTLASCWSGCRRLMDGVAQSIEVAEELSTALVL